MGQNPGMCPLFPFCGSILCPCSGERVTHLIYFVQNRQEKWEMCGNFTLFCKGNQKKRPYFPYSCACGTL